MVKDLDTSTLEDMFATIEVCEIKLIEEEKKIKSKGVTFVAQKEDTRKRSPSSSILPFESYEESQVAQMVRKTIKNNKK